MSEIGQDTRILIESQSGLRKVVQVLALHLAREVVLRLRKHFHPVPHEPHESYLFHRSEIRLT